MPIGTGLGVIIDERGGEVHQQYRKCHCVRILSPGADKVDEDPDTGTEIDSSPDAGRRSHGVGHDKERAQQVLADVVDVSQLT